MRRLAWRLAVLGVLVFASVITIPGEADADPYHLQEGLWSEVSGGSDQVDGLNWAAESILPNTTFLVSRVSLFVSDVAISDVLTVSIRGDFAGMPSTNVLTQASADGPGNTIWLNFDLSPHVELVAGQTYWIVARSTASPNAGYRWDRSTNEFAYPNGTASRSSDGISWVNLSRDYTFRVYGYNQPTFAFSASATNTSLRPGESTTFRANFTNLGPGASEALWVNVSFPSALNYVSDDAASIGGVRIGSNVFAFSNVSAGSYSFNITAIVAGGVANGTVVTTFVFDAMDHIGVPLTRSTWDIPVGIRNARLAVSLGPIPGFVDPGDTITVNATVSSIGLETAVNVVVAAPLDDNVSFVSATAPATFDLPTRTVRRTLLTLAPNEVAFMEWTVRVLPGTPDLSEVASLALVSYADNTGTPLPGEQTVVTATVQSPLFDPVLVINQRAAEGGDEVTATFYYNNTGSVAAPTATANWTLGGHYELVALAPSVPFSPTPSGFVVNYANLAPGPHSTFARLKVLRGLADGLAMDFAVSWAATDGNGNPLPAAPIPESVDLLAPRVTLQVSGPARQIMTYGLFILNLSIRNDGRAPAIAWLNLSLPSGVRYVGDNGTIVPVNTQQSLAWSFPAIALGTTRLEVTLQAGGEPTAKSFRFEVNYTDGSRIAPQAAFSNAATVEFVLPQSTPLANPLPWIALATLLFTAVLFLAWRFRPSKVTVDEVFVADLSGVLLAHRSAKPSAGQDHDVLVAMFKVVQDFVRDAFASGTDEEMRALEFGDRKILIERGKHHFIAVIYRGIDRGHLAARMKKVSGGIDEKYGEVLEHWSGEVEPVKGITLLLPKIWRRRRLPAS